jgi:hypothetical protein
VSRLVDRVVGGLDGWLVGGLVGGAVGLLDDCFAGALVGVLVGRLVGGLVNRLVGGSIHVIGGLLKVAGTSGNSYNLTSVQNRHRVIYELFGRGHGPSKLRSMLLVMVICNLV